MEDFESTSKNISTKENIQIPFSPNKKIQTEKIFGRVTLREYENCDCEGALVFQGFPSTSICSILCAGYLKDQLGLPLIGSISSPTFPSRCIVENGFPIHPLRLYGDRRIVVVMGEFKFPSNEETFSVATAVLDFAKRHKCQMILCAEGVPVESSAEDWVAYVSTSKPFSDKMTELGAKNLNESMIGGITGITLAEGAVSDVDVGCLIAPTSSQFPDAMCAVRIIKSLNSILGNMCINLEPLTAKAHALQKSVSQLLKSDDNHFSGQSMYM